MASPGKITQDDDELVGGETDISLTSALKEINKSVKDLTLSQDNFQFNIKAEIEKLKVAVNESIELKLQEFSVGLDMSLQNVNKRVDVTLLTKRLTHLENQNVQGASAGVHADTRRPAGMSKPTDPFDPEVSIIVSNLPEENDEDLKMKINTLIKEGLQIQNLETVNAERLAARYGQPGLIKAQLQSENAKIQVLRSKKALLTTKDYKGVFLRGAKSHVERLIELNFKTILGEMPNGSNYRVTNSGRLVSIDTLNTNVDMQATETNHGGGRGRGHFGRGRGVPGRGFAFGRGGRSRDGRQYQHNEHDQHQMPVNTTQHSENIHPQSTNTATPTPPQPGTSAQTEQ